MNDTKIIDAINKLIKSKNNYDANVLYIDSHGKGETIKASNAKRIQIKDINLFDDLADENCPNLTN